MLPAQGTARAGGRRLEEPRPLPAPQPAQVLGGSEEQGGPGGFDSRSVHCLSDQHHFHTIITLPNPLLILLLSCKASRL